MAARAAAATRSSSSAELPGWKVYTVPSGPAEESTSRLPDLSKARLTGSRGLSRSTSRPSLLRPGINALVVMIDEIELARCVDSRAGDGEEAVFELLHRCAGSEDGGCVRRRGRSRIGWDVQDGEFALADFEVMRHVFDRIFVGEFAEAQKGAAAVVVADGIAALSIHVNVAEMNVRMSCRCEQRRGTARANGSRDRRGSWRW